MGKGVRGERYYLVPFHHQLVSSANQLQLICLVKLFHDISAEQVTCATRAQTPTVDILRETVKMKISPYIRSEKKAVSMKYVMMEERHRNSNAREEKGGKEGGNEGTPSGSDHIRSHIAPSWGTSCFRSKMRIWSRVLIEGERPPCTQKILSSIIAKVKIIIEVCEIVH